MARGSRWEWTSATANDNIIVFLLLTSEKWSSPITRGITSLVGERKKVPVLSATTEGIFPCTLPWIRWQLSAVKNIEIFIYRDQMDFHSRCSWPHQLQISISPILPWRKSLSEELYSREAFQRNECCVPRRGKINKYTTSQHRWRPSKNYDSWKTLHMLV